MLKDKQRKYLTELLGECWHVKGNTGYCQLCGEPLQLVGDYNRTFTTPQDFFDVVRAIEYDDLPNYNITEMQQPDFVERFMIEVCKMGGVE